jgi:hypothetical protein
MTVNEMEITKRALDISARAEFEYFTLGYAFWQTLFTLKSPSWETSTKVAVSLQFTPHTTGYISIS